MREAFEGVGGARRETRYGYDADGRRNYVLSPNGLETRTAFDAGGREIETKTRAGGRDYVTRKGYDRFGRLVWSQDPQQSSVSPALYTTYLYVTDHDNSTNWTAADDCSGVTDPRYGQLAIVFHEDNDNNPLNNDNYISAAPAKMFEMYGYDSQGRQTDVVKPASLGDQAGYATAVCTRTNYDSQGRVESVIMNYRDGVTSDSKTNLKFVFHYDSHGNRSEVVYPSGLIKQWQYKYNGDDRLTSMTETQVGYAAAPPAWKKTSYDPVTGLSSALTDAVGNVTLSEYNLNSQLLRTLHTPASTPSQPAWNVNYSYDDSGRISEVKSFAGSGAIQQIYGETREYDNETGGISKVSKSADGTGIGTLNYTYNNQGALASMSWLGRSVSYDYDEFGRIKTARANEADWEYTYAPCGKKSTVHNTRQNEIEKIEYDGLGRIISISHENAATDDPIFQITYRLGPDGNRVGAYERRKTADDDIATSWSYTYDALSRLIRERRSIKNSPQGEYAPDHDVSYEYDREHDSSRTKLTDNLHSDRTEIYSYIPGSQRLGCVIRMDDTSTSYTWTANGELAREDNYNGTTLQSTKQYTWGIGGTLSAVRIEDAEKNATVVDYEYDHENELIGRQVTFKGKLVESERYLVDHQNPTGYSQRLAVLDTITGAIRHEIFTDQLAAETTVNSGSANTQYVHSDALGSIRALTGTSSSGKTLGTDAEKHFFDYTAFGSSLRGDRSLTNYSFTGQFKDDLANYQYHRARNYDIRNGLWLSNDPVLDWPLNYGSTYMYCGQNPINGIDMSGCSELLEKVIVASILCILGAIVGYQYGGWKGAILGGLTGAITGWIAATWWIMGATAAELLKIGACALIILDLMVLAWNVADGTYPNFPLAPDVGYATVKNPNEIGKAFVSIENGTAYQTIMFDEFKSLRATYAAKQLYDMGYSVTYGRPGSIREFAACLRENPDLVFLIGHGNDGNYGYDSSRLELIQNPSTAVSTSSIAKVLKKNTNRTKLIYLNGCNLGRGADNFEVDNIIFSTTDVFGAPTTIGLFDFLNKLKENKGDVAKSFEQHKIMMESGGYKIERGMGYIVKGATQVKVKETK